MYQLAVLIGVTIVSIAIIIVATAYAFSVVSTVNDRRARERMQAQKQAKKNSFEKAHGAVLPDVDELPSALERRINDVTRPFSLKQRMQIRRKVNDE